MMGNAGKTLGDSIITNHATGAGFRNIPMEQVPSVEGVHNGILFEASEF